MSDNEIELIKSIVELSIKDGKSLDELFIFLNRSDVRFTIFEWYLLENKEVEK